MNMLNRLRSAAAVFLILSVVISLLQPSEPVDKNPPGFTLTLPALQLAESVGEIYDIAGRPQTEAGKEAREGYLNGSYLDFLYMISYFCAYLFLAMILNRNGSIEKTHLYTLIFMLILTVSADIYETLTFIEILKEDDPLEVLAMLPFFQLANYLKLLLLGFAGAIAGMGLIREKKTAAGIFLVTAFFLAMASLFRREAVQGEILFLSAAWVLLFVKSLPIGSRAYWSE